MISITFLAESQALVDQSRPLPEGESRAWIADTPEAAGIVASGRMIVKYLDNENFGVKLIALCSHDVADNAIVFILTFQFYKAYCSNIFDFYSRFAAAPPRGE